jgi:hypothetical protein
LVRKVKKMMHLASNKLSLKVIELGSQAKWTNLSRAMNI